MCSANYWNRETIQIALWKNNRNTKLVFIEEQYLVQVEFVSFFDVYLRWKQEFNIDLVWGVGEPTLNLHKLGIQSY